MTARPFVVGGDLSSKNLAFVARHPLTPTASVVKYELAPPSQKFTYKNCDEALTATIDYIDGLEGMILTGSPRLAYLEAPVVAGARNIQSTVKQAMVSGAVQAAFSQAGFTVQLVPISTWKMVVVGHGGSSKADVARSVRGRWPVIANAADGDQDIIDAAAVCLYGEDDARKTFGYV